MRLPGITVLSTLLPSCTNVLPSVVGQVIKVDVKGHNNVARSWADSYYADGKCWCDNSNFAEGMTDMIVPTINGEWWSLPDVCAALGGPGVKDGDPIYNDIQCGRGPPAQAPDELTCPGRVDLGNDGCGDFGSYWDLSVADPSKATNRVLPKPDDAHPDIVVVIDIVGRSDANDGWADSYSVGNECFCISTFDHHIGTFMYDTQSSMGYLSVEAICRMLGPGPGRTADTPVYNDIQCGNGPPNSAGDEQRCPGRVDMGQEGCGHIGPKWNLAPFLGDTPNPTSTPPTSASPTIAPPTRSPSTMLVPTEVVPTSSLAPTAPTSTPVADSPTPVGPTPAPTPRPTEGPTQGPSAGITTAPTTASRETPTAAPSTVPTFVPTPEPITVTPAPTPEPTPVPSEMPSIEPSATSSLEPSSLLSEMPSGVPSMGPSMTPSSFPSAEQSQAPSTAPISKSAQPVQHSFAFVLSLVTATGVLFC